MRITRIYTGTDNESHFEDIDIPTIPGERRWNVSGVIATEGAGVRESEEGPTGQGWHQAPRRQLVTVLSGVLEIECADGARRQFRPGEALLADDTSGHGHLTRYLDPPMRLLLIYLTPELDLSAWRA